MPQKLYIICVRLISLEIFRYHNMGLFNSMNSKIFKKMCNSNSGKMQFLAQHRRNNGYKTLRVCIAPNVSQFQSQSSSIGISTETTDQNS